MSYVVLSSCVYCRTPCGDQPPPPVLWHVCFCHSADWALVFVGSWAGSSGSRAASSRSLAVDPGLDLDPGLPGLDPGLAGEDAGEDPGLAGVDIGLAGVNLGLAGVDIRLAGVDPGLPGMDLGC